METTAKGAHYFMLRSPLCDQLGLYDKADCFLTATQSKAFLLQPTPMGQGIAQSARYAFALIPVSCGSAL